jgi:response regulator RpfG family c-di-GMP phosphodiesterase
MEKKIVVLIDDSSDELDMIEEVIKEIDPFLMCTSFIYADEAVKVVSDELKRQPHYIFIDVDMTRKTGTECLTELRRKIGSSNCKIIMFSIMMPKTVAEAFISMGADYAFQKPASKISYKDILIGIFENQSFQ